MKNSRSRRGVLLLVVLGLLAMFAMLAVAFIALTRNEISNSRGMALVDTSYQPGEKDVHFGINVVFSGGTTNSAGFPVTAINGQCLLGGIYNSHDTVICSIGTPTTLCGQQLVAFTLSPTSGANIVGHSVGCILTMISGNAAGLSSRIVGLGPSPDAYSTTTPMDSCSVEVVAFEGGVQPKAGDQCIVSGVPYSGMGLGYNQQTGLNNATDSSSNPLAFLPNSPLNWDPPGGTNVDYTAADQQSPYLALQIAQTGSNGRYLCTPLPSYHRPELIAFWANKLNNSPSAWQKLPATMLRQIMYRPNPADHPIFNQYVNPNFNAVWDGVTPGQGQWDVDNDGDGVPDSVWVDLGAPVRTTADGRTYKPLFAILCVDLDGRLNVNAHGMIAQTNQAYYSAPGSSENPLSQYGSLLPQQATGGTPVSPRGLGTSPAEINLRPLFAAFGNGGDLTAYGTLLKGNAGQKLNGRYGEVGGNPMPGQAGAISPKTYNHNWDYSGNYWGFLTTAQASWGSTSYWVDGYGSPPDPQHYGVVQSDMAGRPMWYSLGGPLTNTPNDVNLNVLAPHAANIAPVDDPFGWAEFERILRQHDRDTPILPNRLALVTSPDGNPNDSALLNISDEVTVLQSSVPTPSIAAPASVRAGLPAVSQGYGFTASNGQADNRPHHFVDLVLAAILGQNKGMTAQQAMSLIPGLVAPEMIAGLKLNLNRPLSDWPASKTAGYQLYSTPSNLYSLGSANFSLNPTGGSNSQNPIAARQLQARYLFVLGMLSVNSGQLQVFSETSLSPQQQTELTVRRMAQWAINAVCYSTPDSVMVPFKYNVNPFTKMGWTADTNLSNPYSDASGNPCNVVWGCKPPELLISEVAAFHNRRVADTNFDNGPKKKRTDIKTGTKQPTAQPGDPDLDQARIPQGSAFIELYCPRGPAMGAAPSDLYVFQTDPNDKYGTTSGKWMLNLGLMAPAGNYGALPVWRMVVTDSTIKPKVGTAAGNNILKRVSQYPDSSSMETVQIANPNTPPSTQGTPPSFSLLSNATNPANATPVAVDRIVWFASTPPPGNYPDANLVYFNQLGTQALLPGGQYAIVGSRPVTYMSAVPPTGTTLGTPGQQSMHLLSPTAYTQDVRYIAGAGSAAPSSALQQKINLVKPALGIVVAGGGPKSGTSYPSGWTRTAQTAPYGIGFSISEPLFSPGFSGVSSYYPEPSVNSANASDTGMQWYGDPNQTDSTKPFLDHPLEPSYADATTPPSPNVLEVNANDTAQAVVARPIVRDNLSATETVPNYKTIFLQRLANPTAAFDPINNPYLTVDWMPMDLTVYNGDDLFPSAQWATLLAANKTTWPATWDTDDPSNGAGKTQFWSRQRGTLVPDVAMSQYYPGHYGQSVMQNLYAQISDPPIAPAKNSVSGGVQTPSPNFNYDLQHTLGYLNTAFQNGAAPGAAPGLTSPTAHIGDPTTPFPWLTWNGRPYVSELELLMVPSSHPGRLLWEFQCPPPSAPADAANLYQPNQAAAGGPVSPDTIRTYNPYPHLLNFFQSQTPSGAAGGQQPTNLQRILEYVGVPSRFPSAEIQINPSTAVGATGQHWFHPPFNRISMYREPGKINLNTLVSFDVFQGLMNNYPGMATMPMYEKFVRSRWEDPMNGPPQGFTPPSTLSGIQSEMFTPPNGPAPTRFLRPFRSAAAASLEPQGLAPTREIDAGLLRADPDYANRPLWESDNKSIQTAGGSSWPASYDANRNGYYRYQSLQRLANLTTTRSNVFAIWITVGYFEVTPAPNGVDAGHADGYQLGQELGSDTGDIVRHRGFYIFDRSIPMAYQRAVDINNSKGVLLQRYIE